MTWQGIAADPENAPITGWTRVHWEAVADEQIAAAWRYSSPGGAQVRFPAGREQDAEELLEGFARTFLLGAMRLAGAAGDPEQVPAGLADWYARALDAGTDPESGERWPLLTDHSQTTVEATGVALGLHLTRRWIWDGLPQKVRDNTASWLSGSAHSYGADNNHVLFAATIQAFLASAGYAHDGAGIEGALARIEDWYVGDGWYSDGEGRRFDHYNAWTFHLYPFFILDMLAEPEATGRREVYRDRLGQFVHGYSHLFGANGSPLIQGRSLIYRWGVAAPFWMALREGVTAVSPGLTRRLASGTLKYFLAGGAALDGVPTLGWHGADSSILQSYNAPGSSHWAAKGFLGLLLPASHPAWTDVEEPLPVESGDFAFPLAAPAQSGCSTAAVTDIPRTTAHSTAALLSPQPPHPGSTPAAGTMMFTSPAPGAPAGIADCAAAASAPQAVPAPFPWTRQDATLPSKPPLPSSTGLRCALHGSRECWGCGRLFPGMPPARRNRWRRSWRERRRRLRTAGADRTGAHARARPFYCWTATCSRPVAR